MSDGQSLSLEAFQHRGDGAEGLSLSQARHDKGVIWIVGNSRKCNFTRPILGLVGLQVGAGIYILMCPLGSSDRRGMKGLRGSGRGSCPWALTPGRQVMAATGLPCAPAVAQVQFRVLPRLHGGPGSPV